MVPMGQGNWNIPHGKYPEEHSGELFVPKNHFTDEKTYEYKFDIDSTYNRDDAIQFCARYGMSQASKFAFRYISYKILYNYFICNILYVTYKMLKLIFISAFFKPIVRLPEPTSEAMTDEILKMWKNDNVNFRGPIFLGLSDEVEPNRFVWDSNGEDLEYTFWARRKGPQESETENYAIMRGKIIYFD